MVGIDVKTGEFRLVGGFADELGNKVEFLSGVDGSKASGGKGQGRSDDGEETHVDVFEACLIKQDVMEVGEE